jgi:hypothetical protein
MANGVRTTVNAVQPSFPDSPIDGVRAQPERHELPAGDNAVLPPRKAGDRPVEGVLRNLTAHYAAK